MPNEKHFTYLLCDTTYKSVAIKHIETIDQVVNAFFRIALKTPSISCKLFSYLISKIIVWQPSLKWHHFVQMYNYYYYASFLCIPPALPDSMCNLPVKKLPEANTPYREDKKTIQVNNSFSSGQYIIHLGRTASEINTNINRLKAMNQFPCHNCANGLVQLIEYLLSIREKSLSQMTS